MADPEYDTPRDELDAEALDPPATAESANLDTPEHSTMNLPTGDEESKEEESKEEGAAIEVVESVFRSTTPSVTLPKDHFTLSHPTTTIRYRRSNNAARIIEDNDKQYILEETDAENGEHEITIRQLHDTSEGVRFLRITYAIATAFWTGFFFILCVQILLFVFLDLAIQFGITSGDEPQYLAALGVMFSILPFIHGLSSGLVIAGVYVMDTARGHPLTGNFTFERVNRIVVEWVYFFFFIGLPGLSLCFSLISGTNDFWAFTTLIWFCSILVFFFVFAYNVVFFEIKACFEVIRNRYHTDNDSWLEVIKRAIYLRQVSMYGGYKTITVVSFGALKDSEYTEKVDEKVEIPGTRQIDLSWRAKLTTYQGFLQANMYEVLETPEHIYTCDDARDVRPFITRYTWSLDKVFCRPRRSRYIAIVGGPGALTRAQMKSSIACSVVGSVIILLLILSIFIYMEAPSAATIFGIIVAVLIATPNIKSTIRLWKISKKLIFLRTDCKDDGGRSERSLHFSMRADGDTRMTTKESEGIYITSERYRVTKPTRWFAFTMFGIEFFILFFWPVASYFAIGNWPIGMVYAFTVGVAGMRYYFNAGLVLEETGHMNLVDGKSEKERWTAQSRLDDIIGNITRGRSIKAWNSLLGLLGLVFLALFVGTVGSGLEDINSDFGSDPVYVSANLFQYQQEDALRYPTCSLTSDLGDSPIITMADYAFLAGHGYRGAEVSQEALDSFFGEGTVVDRQDLVDDYRVNVTESRVSFKLITAQTETGRGDFAYLVIRGTVTPWDAMTDAQLWAPASLLQFLRLLLPFGEMWTPVLPYLISSITYVESEALEKISFYKDTVAFAEWLREKDIYAGIAITGHSLGGGLAMITGAITGLPAVGLSGPNAVLSRRSFEPMISVEDLDRYTFNIVPERDVVPMLDDKAQNYQMIRCQGEFSDVVGCHSPLRALCEISFTCGSVGRPVICDCVEQFNFPPPKPVGNTSSTFAEACAEAKAANGLPGEL